MNAFATGPTRSRALVAVSSGLLQGMEKSEIEAVLGHEITHIANGDMVTMTLIQGVINAFVMFIARVVAGRPELLGAHSLSAGTPSFLVAAIRWPPPIFRTLLAVAKMRSEVSHATQEIYGGVSAALARSPWACQAGS